MRGATHQSQSSAWGPPPPSFLKCNTDATFDHTRAAGASSMVFRDREGFLEFCSVKKINLLPLNWQGCLPSELRRLIEKDKISARRATMTSALVPSSISADVFRPP
ncbi:hypothetical protein SESBI_41772 [Sesbania bispinosa]|nr:hypothetical protein SESBI_41772 [Sesbania bispinosa]